MTAIVVCATILALTLQPSITASKIASERTGSTLRECQDAGRLADVTLRFCSWKEDGNWNVSFEVKNGNAVTKSVRLDCSRSNFRQLISDALSAGAEKNFLRGTLHGSTPMLGQNHIANLIA